MSLQRRFYSSLPGYLQTNRNNLESAVTDDLLYEPEQAQFVSGFIGDTSKLTAQDLKRTPRLIENSALRQKYQFSVSVAQFDPVAQDFVSGAFYDDLLNHLALNGALIDDPNRLFSTSYYAWSPPVDYDKLVNPARYFWTGGGTAAANGEYITKEVAGSLVTIHQFDGSSLVPHTVSTVNGLPGSGSGGQIVEDVSTSDRFIYQWTGAAWARINFLLADSDAIKPTYFAGDYVYVCRTGPNFNRPVVWVYRPTVGRWVGIPVVVSFVAPDIPSLGMIWEDPSTVPARRLRIWDGGQWQLLATGLADVFDASPITYSAGAPSGTPTVVTYRYDTRGLAAVDTWSAQNWWREFTDLSSSDKAALGGSIQAARPIIEFWGNIEPASGDTRTSRNQFPLFNLYAVSTSTFNIVPITPGNFSGLDTTPLTASGNYVGGEAVSHIFNYVKLNGGTPDAVLGFRIQYASDGTPLFYLELERLPITVSGSPLVGYRYFRDTATGYVHSIWEKGTSLLTQTADSNGLYNIPPSLKSNSDHDLLDEISRSQFVNHMTAVMKAQSQFAGTPFGTNNYRFTPKNLSLGATMIDPEETPFRAMAVLQTNTLDIPDAIRAMGREYNKVMFKFVTQMNNLWNLGTIADPTDTLIVTADQAVDIILTNIFAGRNSEFPFFYSNMGTFTETRITSGTVYIFDPTLQPIYIPNSAAQIGAAPVYTPQKFTDHDGLSKIRGHDGSLIPAFGDARDTIMLALETRFFNAVPSYLRSETASFSSRFNTARFHLADYYGNFTPNLTAGKVAHVVSNFNTIVSPSPNERVYSSNTNVFAIWDGTRWLTQDAATGDVFQDTATGNYWIFNGFFAEIIPTHNNTSVTFDYSTNEFRLIIQREFERWVVQHQMDFITNDDFDNNNLFTWNFTSSGLEGNYRGIYRRVYRTIRPHTHPWEVIGYSVRPDWWFTSYVPTSFAVDGTPRYANSHAMWVDFQNGVINPNTATINLRQKMVAPIPVDSSGNLLDPIAAGIILEQALTPASIGDDWAYGDDAPIEDSFYASYFYPFSVALAGYLMKPGIFVDRTWSEFYRTVGDTGSNLLWTGPHTVYNLTLTRPQVSQVASQLSLDTNGDVVVNPGFNAWIAEYANLIGVSPHDDFDNAIKNCEAVLGWKTSGFINKNRTKVELLNGDEIPNEDISVVLHQGPSLNEYFQSGIQIVRDTDGFRVFGTDVLNPVFRVELGAKPISGGQIETLQSFVYDGTKIYAVDDPNTLYERSAVTTTNLTVPPTTNDTATFSILVNGFRIQDKFVQRIDAVTFGIDQFLQLSAGDKITASVVTTASNPSTQLGSFTINHVTVTYFQTGTGVFVDYPYGHLFETLSDVVNMMIGYGRWLSSQGWIFQRLTNGVLRDWLGASQAFVKWATDLGLKTRFNPTLMKGSIFEFSVMGRQAQFEAPFGMVLGIEEIRNGSYGVVDSNGQPIRGQNLDVVSTGGSLTVSSDNTDVFGLRLYVSEVQHVVFFPNTTIFGDIIYEPVLGLAQDAVFVDTYRTTNWAGRMEAPGSLILGGRLLPNWEKQANDITRIYDRFNPPDDPVLLAMARNIYGYAPQAYLEELAIDDRSQFNFFRGVRKASGTFQPYKAYIRGTTLGTDGVNISEDWAWKFARMGDRRIVTVLFTVDEVDFVDTFQVIHFTGSTFDYSFTGNAVTTCFEVPQQFVPTDAVVLVAGTLQVLIVDYVVNQIASGNEICFVVPPNNGSAIDVSINKNYHQGIVNAFYEAAQLGGTTIDTGFSLRSNNAILALNGNVQSPLNYTVANDSVTYTQNAAANLFVVGDVADDVFLQTIYRGDSISQSFFTKRVSQTDQSVIVTLDGLWQTPGVDYTMITLAGRSAIQFTSVPSLAQEILVIEAAKPTHMRSMTFVAIGDGATTQFNIPGITLSSYRQTMIAVNGVLQVGPIPSSANTYTFQSGGVKFNSPPPLGQNIAMFVLLGVIGDVATPLGDDRIIQIPTFSPPNNDGRWVLPPPQDVYEGRPYSFPTKRDGTIDLDKYIFTAKLVDQNAVAPATELFHWDPAKDIHEPVALSLLEYKTVYDPARYNQGPLVEAAGGLLWGELQVGQVWWKTSKAIYEDYESFLPDEMRVTREWGRLKYFPATITRVDQTVTVTTLDPKTKVPVAHGFTNGDTIVISGADQPTYNGLVSVVVASGTTFTFEVNFAADTPGTGDIIVEVGMINCYEWVASPVPPSLWGAYVQSQSNQFNAYSGTVRNASNPSYATREVWDVNGNSSTTYYFWVENNTRTIPEKDFSVTDIAGRLRDPAQYEVPYFGIIDPTTMFVFIGADTVLDNYGIEATYEWFETPRHIEWMLIGENDDFVRIPALVTDKLLDSLIGTDVHGNAVPNVTLAPVEKYGTCFFPQQSVFQNPVGALTIFVDSINELLIGVDIKSFFELFQFIVGTADEKTNLNPNGFFVRTTYWVPGIDHSIVYDTVVTLAELNLRTSLGLYAADDVVKVISSDLFDIWSPTVYTLASAAIADAGNGYLVGDTITLLGGNRTIIAELTVAAVSGGNVTQFTISNVGHYTSIPPNPILTQTSGAGTGFSINATWAHTPIISAYYQYDGSTWQIAGIQDHTIEINSNIVLNPTQMRDFFEKLTTAFDELDTNDVVFKLLYEMLRQNPICDWFFKTSYIDIHVSKPLPTSVYVRPDEAVLVLNAIRDLKPFRTKLRDELITLFNEEENATVTIDESQIERVTLIFDRLACDLTDENSWDTIPWDATVTSPDNTEIDLTFIGNGVQSYFTLPEIVPQNALVVLLNGDILLPNLDYVLDSAARRINFNTIPAIGDVIHVLIDAPFAYLSMFDYHFAGDGVIDSEILPETVLTSATSASDVISSWNGVYQLPVTNFTIQVTSDTEVVYGVTPPAGVEVDGLVLGGVSDAPLTSFLFTSDGVTTQYHTNIGGLSVDTVIVSINGVWQSANHDFSINTTSPSDNLVVLVASPASGAKILVYAATAPAFIVSKLYQFTGDASTTLFSVPNLTGAVVPEVLVNLDGIQQVPSLDFTKTTGIQFVTPPAANVKVDVWVVWGGIGNGLANFAFPTTIQWDWAYWDYADLGRQEYDFAGIFVGDGVTDTYTISIPQTSTFLYNTVIKLYQNGVETTAAALGLTMTSTKLASSVIVFFSGALPDNVYGGLYIARGLYEGLEPTFGFQDPNGVVFTPTAASYQHFFARLISPTFDPSTVMNGCPTPEERIETGFDDMFTIAVRTEILDIHLPVVEPVIVGLIGVQATAHFGSFSLITVSPFIALTGVAAVSHVGTPSVMSSSALSLTGLEATSAVGALAMGWPNGIGLQATSQLGTFVPALALSLAGVAATSELATVVPSWPAIGLEVVSAIGTFGRSATFGMAGVVATGQTGTMPAGHNIPLSGVEAASQFGAPFMQKLLAMTGLAATTEFGVVVASEETDLSGLVATSDVGTITVSIV